MHENNGRYIIVGTFTIGKGLRVICVAVSRSNRIGCQTKCMGIDRQGLNGSE